MGWRSVWGVVKAPEYRNAGQLKSCLVQVKVSANFKVGRFLPASEY